MSFQSITIYPCGNSTAHPPSCCQHHLQSSTPDESTCTANRKIHEETKHVSSTCPYCVLKHPDNENFVPRENVALVARMRSLEEDVDIEQDLLSKKGVEIMMDEDGDSRLRGNLSMVKDENDMESERDKHMGLCTKCAKVECLSEGLNWNLKDTSRQAGTDIEIEREIMERSGSWILPKAEENDTEQATQNNTKPLTTNPTSPSSSSEMPTRNMVDKQPHEKGFPWSQSPKEETPIIQDATSSSPAVQVLDEATSKDEGNQSRHDEVPKIQQPRKANGKNFTPSLQSTSDKATFDSRNKQILGEQSLRGSFRLGNEENELVSTTSTPLKSGSSKRDSQDKDHSQDRLHSRKGTRSQSFHRKVATKADLNPTPTRTNTTPHHSTSLAASASRHPNPLFRAQTAGLLPQTPSPRRILSEGGRKSPLVRIGRRVTGLFRKEKKVWDSEEEISDAEREREWRRRRDRRGEGSK